MAISASVLHWLTRPHLFTFLLVAIWVISLERMRNRQSSRWWLLPLSMLFWVNLHGAFIAGFAILLIYWVGYLWDFVFIKEDDFRASTRLFRKHLLWGSVTSLAVTMLNPGGINVWKTGIGFIGNAYLVNNTIEYLSPDFHQAYSWPFLIIVLLSMVLLGINQRRISATSIFMIVAWTAMGMFSARNIPIFAVVVTPVLGEIGTRGIQLNKAFTRFINLDTGLLVVEKTKRYFSWAIPFTLIIILLLSQGMNLSSSKFGNTFDPRIFPVGAVNWLEKNPQGNRVFNEFTWGGYILYRLWPDQKVFIDGQTDFYGEQLTRQYAQVISMQDGWQQVIKEFNVDWMLLPANSVLASGIVKIQGWHIVYQDETAVVISYDQ